MDDPIDSLVNRYGRETAYDIIKELFEKQDKLVEERMKLFPDKTEEEINEEVIQLFWEPYFKKMAEAKNKPTDSK
jgi:predicted CopG family antitoxin